jgi:hypothetical protein
MSSAASQLTIAERFVARGMSVIPVPRPCVGTAVGMPGDGKVPAIQWKDYQDRLPTDAELVAWFGAEPMNLAVITGAVSGVVVIDADDRAALLWCTRHLPYTPWQTETRRGFHLWYRHPGARVANRARLETGEGRLAIDVRGDGGFVIAPGSVHATGAEYRFAGDWNVSRDEIPRFWPGWLERSTRAAAPRTSNAPRFTGDVVDRARRYLAAIPVPEIGCASDNGTLYAACRLVRGFGLSAAVAEELLWDWAGGRPGWTRQWIAQKVANAERFGTETVGALR